MKPTHTKILSIVVLLTFISSIAVPDFALAYRAPATRGVSHFAEQLGDEMNDESAKPAATPSVSLNVEAIEAVHELHDKRLLMEIKLLGADIYELSRAITTEDREHMRVAQLMGAVKERLEGMEDRLRSDDFSIARLEGLGLLPDQAHDIIEPLSHNIMTILGAQLLLSKALENHQDDVSRSLEVSIKAVEEMYYCAFKLANMVRVPSVSLGHISYVEFCRHCSMATPDIEFTIFKLPANGQSAPGESSSRFGEFIETIDSHGRKWQWDKQEVEEIKRYLREHRDKPTIIGIGGYSLAGKSALRATFEKGSKGCIDLGVAINPEYSIEGDDMDYRLRNIIAGFEAVPISSESRNRNWFKLMERDEEYIMEMLDTDASGLLPYSIFSPYFSYYVSTHFDRLFESGINSAVVISQCNMEIALNMAANKGLSDKVNLLYVEVERLAEGRRRLTVREIPDSSSRFAEADIGVKWPISIGEELLINGEPVRASVPEFDYVLPYGVSAIGVSSIPHLPLSMLVASSMPDESGEQDNNLNRRSFLKRSVVAGAGAAIAGSAIYKALKSDDTTVSILDDAEDARIRNAAKAISDKFNGLYEKYKDKNPSETRLVRALFRKIDDSNVKKAIIHHPQVEHKRDNVKAIMCMSSPSGDNKEAPIYLSYNILCQPDEILWAKMVHEGWHAYNKTLK